MRFHFADEVPSLTHKSVGERLHVVTAGPGVHHVGNAGFLLKVELSVPRDSRRMLARKSNCFIQGVRVQRLSLPEHRGHRLDARPATLFDVSCAARLQPEVCACVRSAIDFALFGLKPFTIFAQSTRAARNLAISMK